MPASPGRRPVSAPGSASITRSASTRAWPTARRARPTNQNARGYVDDRLRRPAAPSPTSPPAQPPTTGLRLTRRKRKAMPCPSRRARSEPVPKSAGLYLRRRLPLSHHRGPRHTVQRWAAGDALLPPTVPRNLARLVAARQDELGKLYRELASR